MPKVVTTPRHLKPYEFHGVNLEVVGDNALGDCPFCGGEGKFSVLVPTGVWRCFVCGAGTDKGGGNVYTFLRLLWDASDKATNGATKVLAAERKLLFPETLTYWGVCQSVLTKDWLVPGYGADGKIVQLYRYLRVNGRMALLPTPELHHGIIGMPLFDPRRPNVFICEGPWDALALWEVLRSAKQTDEGLKQTGAEASSLLSTTSVLAVHSCGAVGEPFRKFLPLLAGKRVVTMFDSDHPHQHHGKTVQGAGLLASIRAAQIMASSSEHRPESLGWLHWGELGYDPQSPSGYDVKDWLTQSSDLQGRIARLDAMLKDVKPIPDEWVGGRTRAAARKGGTELELLPCTSWSVLVNSWRKALKWIDGLDRALSVMLAAVTSTESVGDQLWVKIIGPPSCGKSVLCEALSVNRKWITPKSSIRGLFSGYQVDREGSEDMSLAAKIKNHTLITKDGDTLLTMPDLPRILAEFRDLYDRVSRTTYRNRMSKDYEGLSMTWILCGTESLRTLDSSELGERLLDCVIIDRMDEDVEDAIALKKAYQADRELSCKSDGKPETRDGPEMLEAKRLTGGYVDHLRNNAQELLACVDATEGDMRRCVALGTFVAYMRSRPSKKQDETVQRELSFRLTSQMVRLAKCLAVVLNKRTLDEEVMRRTTQVALDTARGRTFELVRHLHAVGLEGASVGALAVWTGHGDTAEGRFLRFLKRLGAVEPFDVHARDGRKTGVKWKLTRRLSRLCKEILDA